MCFEEIFANVVFYAYEGQKGNITVSISKNNNDLLMQVEDN